MGIDSYTTELTVLLENAFQMSASTVRFGAGVTSELGLDLQELRAENVLLVIDPRLLSLSVGKTVLESLTSAGIRFAVFDRVRVEPTDRSFRDAATFAAAGQFDAYVAVGGGSTIDTAKAANLYATYPADLLDYVNVPVGKGKPVPGPLKPLIAIPTTAGTGSEATGTAIFDFVERHVKTGIAHRYLKPTLGLIDPDNTATLPSAVAAATGLDVLSHALESYTAIPFHQRPRPARPSERPAYQGCNPISDLWSLRALEITAEHLPRAVRNPQDVESRGQMLLAAAMAGIGFGNAGVHLPHAMAYPVAGMVRDFWPAGYETDHPMVPHGISVILNTPAVARFTAKACPERHLQAARALGADIREAPADSAGEILATQIIRIMRELQLPAGLSAIGYTENDIPALIEGTQAQSRITKLSPRPASSEDLHKLFLDSMRLWT